MEELDPREPEQSPEEQIRALGFNPDFLTPEERLELLELQSLFPDEALSV